MLLAPRVSYPGFLRRGARGADLSTYDYPLLSYEEWFGVGYAGRGAFLTILLTPILVM